jgi:serine/threonine protein kinase
LYVYRDNITPQVIHLFPQLTGIASGSAGILIIRIILCARRKASSSSPQVFLKKTHDQDLKDLIRHHVPPPLKEYSFSDVEKMTNFFKDKLGQGGYGTVYKGRLPDGHLVAVKVLVASEGNAEEYINEVASISRTSHVNVVTLLGFCLERDKRFLIFDFMPNGSLEKFINHENAFEASQQLGWEKLYQIVIGVARGLEYLHRGCNTRIVHFDIKPHNILLDADFCPKISDFGLAKSCTGKESNVSLLEARGTIGYIAPEVFSRNFGRVSYKSDVYSYGMMVLEMVGGKKNHEAEISSGSEKYFPEWIYKHLEVDDESGINGVPTSEQADSVRKIIIVGLWCIQTNPADRPSMSKVLEMLEGPIGALNIPPRPFLSSPPRLIPYSTTTSLT